MAMPSFGNNRLATSAPAMPEASRMGRGIDFGVERMRMVDRLVRSGYIKAPTIRAAFKPIHNHPM